jgi:tRNA threonylcarbamoyladenosine dehydratase
MDDVSERFGGVGRLYGSAGLGRFLGAHVMVVGIGGVGSWTAEALARTGIGRVTLVDLDEICVTNVNRQVHALEETVGLPKVEVMARRLRSISPGIRADAVTEFFHAENASRLLGLEPGTEGNRPDVVVDAIDAMANKVRLIALCHGKGIPVVVCGAAGGRRDPTRIRSGDLAEATHDRLLAEVRKRLRKEHGLSRDGSRLGIPCVFSPETQMYPDGEGGVCAERKSGPDQPMRLNCASGFGSAAVVTGTFGFAAAALVFACLSPAPVPTTPSSSS